MKRGNPFSKSGFPVYRRLTGSKTPISRSKVKLKILSGGTTARKCPISSSNNQRRWGRLTTGRPIATSALARPMRRETPTD